MPTRSTAGKAALVLPGSHRTAKKCASGFYIRWTAWRGRGAPEIGSYKGKTKAEAEALERDDTGEIARRFGEARSGFSSIRTLAGVLERYEASAEFKKCADSTKAARSRLIKLVVKDPLPPSNKPLGTLPTAALKDRRMVSRMEMWRDAQADLRGPRAADQRVELVRLALNWAMPRGYAPANPAAGLTEIWSTDRSELIWEAQHVAPYLAHIKAAIAEIWLTQSATVKRGGVVRLNTKRIASIKRLAAARDALLLATHTGMRREDLAAHSFAERQGPAIAYTARKGARRARTAGKKRRITIVPVLPIAALVYARRWEASGDESPWVITSGRGAPYTPGALGALVIDTAIDAGVPDRGLHDGKGTFCTTMRAEGFSNAEIGEMVDWSEDDVDAIARRYVSAPAIANAMLERIKRRKA